MKTKIVLLLVCCFFFRNSDSQVLRLNTGISYSSFSHKDIDILNSKITSPSLSLGYEYFKENYYELSSEIAYIQKGGKENNFIVINDEGITYIEVDEKLSFVSFSTTFRLKYPFYNSYMYIGFGPKVDCLLSDRKLKSYEYTLNRISFGFKPEIGFSQNLNEKLSVGLNLSYLWNIGRIGKSEYSNLYNTYYSMCFSLGYIIR
jgi:hypothetical protein